MPYVFPGPEWAAQLQDILNHDDAYSHSAKTWEGDFYFVIEADPGSSDPVIIYLDLWHGKCRDAHIVEAAGNKLPEFTISGTIEIYRTIFQKQLDPIEALMRRKLKIQGNLMKIVRSVRATLDLVNCCSMIDTVYADTLAA